MWRFECSILLAALVMPLYWMSIKRMRRMVVEACTNKSKFCWWMGKLFLSTTMATMISGMFIHTIFCCFPIVFNLIIKYTGDVELAAMLVNEFGGFVMVPLYTYYLFIDLGISIAICYLVLKEVLKVPKVCILFTPFVGIILGSVLSAAPNIVITNLAMSFESLGHLMIFVTGYLMCRDI